MVNFRRGEQVINESIRLLKCHDGVVCGGSFEIEVLYGREVRRSSAAPSSHRDATVPPSPLSHGASSRIPATAVIATHSEKVCF